MVEESSMTPTPGIINLEYIKEISRENQSDARDLISGALNQLEDYMQKMETSVADQNWEDLSFITHKLRSSVRIIGATSLQNKLTELEKAANVKQANIPSLFTEVQQMVSEIIKELKKALSDKQDDK